MTHTYAILEVSPAAFAEIKTKLQAAKYEHAFHDDVIDMHGIALKAKKRQRKCKTWPRCACIMQGTVEDCKDSKI